MEELSLRQIQLGELEILKSIKSICAEQNLHYYLFYGTLLGAVRHNGFIPWDDDVDIVMFREDYEKFIQYCKENTEKISPLKLMHYSINPKYPFSIARLCDTRYHVDYDNTVDYGLGLFVDIYPFDGCGDRDHEEAVKYTETFDRILDLISVAGQDKFRQSKDGKLSTTIVKFGVYAFTHLLGTKFFIEMVEKKAKKYNPRSSRFVECLSWHMVISGFPSAGFNDVEEIVFEGETFSAPKDYDMLLRMRYGDYMKLPPKEEQIAHHYYKAYRID